MSKPNQLNRVIAKLDFLPDGLQANAVSRLFGAMVKFFGTAGIRIKEYQPNKVVMVMKNRRKVQNHLGTVHAAAMSLLAESATGFTLGLNLPDDKLPLMKEMKFQYVKRAAKGELVAVAELTDEQIAKIQQEDKGEVNVKVTITDVKGVEPVLCDMTWAWIPKRRT